MEVGRIERAGRCKLISPVPPESLIIRAMLASRLFIHTDRETPAEAEIISHRLMLRAGFVRQLAGGIYSWLPLGWRIASKIAAIVREEMDAAGAAEVFLPAVQPADLWKKSGRWEVYGEELLRFSDRHRREFCFGPTHEEVITDIVRPSAKSYRQLPFNLYQIQTKFRDEIRPRFGVMRAREFIMKDAYSFDADAEGMRASYEAMRAAYCRIFDRIGLSYRMVEADSGAIGGSHSHEFMVLADSGEEAIVYCDAENYAANVERAACAPPTGKRPPPGEEMKKIATPGIRTIAALDEFLGGLPPEKSIKTMIVRGDSGEAALILRGDHSLNLVKAAARPEVGANPRFSDPEETRKKIGAGFGSLGPVNMPLPVVADFGVQNAADFVCGANEDDMHFTGVNFGRDLPEPVFADLRSAKEGDPSPGGRGVLSLCRGIEVGHIFQLGDKYSQALGATVLDADGKSRPILMGCYGIGVTRIAAAAIEQGHDDAGAIFPEAVAPFEVAVAPIGWGRSAEVRTAAERIYADLKKGGADAMLDDRDFRPGVMFAELDLVGIPHRLIIGDRNLKDGKVEYKSRKSGEAELIPLETAAEFVREKIRAAKAV